MRRKPQQMVVEHMLKEQFKIPDKGEIAGAIRTKLAKAGISINAFCQRAGVQRNALAHLERGIADPGLDRVQRMIETADAMIAEKIAPNGR